MDQSWLNYKFMFSLFVCGIQGFIYWEQCKKKFLDKLSLVSAGNRHGIYDICFMILPPPVMPVITIPLNMKNEKLQMELSR